MVERTGVSLLGSWTGQATGDRQLSATWGFERVSRPPKVKQDPVLPVASLIVLWREEEGELQLSRDYRVPSEITSILSRSRDQSKKAIG